MVLVIQADMSDFRPPDQKSMQIHKLYVDKKFRECKSLIEVGLLI